MLTIEIRTDDNGMVALSQGTYIDLDQYIEVLSTALDIRSIVKTGRGVTVTFVPSPVQRIQFESAVVKALVFSGGFGCES